MSRTIEAIELEIQDFKIANPDWIQNKDAYAYLTSLNQLLQQKISTAPEEAKPLKFLGLLKKRIPNPDPNIIRRAFEKFPNFCQIATTEQSSEFAEKYYEFARRYPCTETVQTSELSHVILDGPLADNSSVFRLFKKNDNQDYVFKTCQEIEYRRAVELLTLADFGSCPSLTKVEIHCLPSQEIEHKYVMVMPDYGHTIELKPFSPDILNKLIFDILAALNYLHTKGFAHMDIKTTNICNYSAGHYVLIDIGSTVRFGLPTSSTHAFLPQELVTNTRLLGSASVDYWMFAIVLLSKVSSYEPGTGVRQPSKSEILARLTTAQTQQDGYPCLRDFVEILRADLNSSGEGTRGGGGGGSEEKREEEKEQEVAGEK